MNESELTRNCVRELNRIPNCWAHRNHGGPHARAGLPDIEGCFRGEFFGIEMKMPGKEKNLTDIQAATLRAIRKARGRAGVATDFDGCLKVLGLKRSQEW